eukprot:TRINITY_DN3288_c0_g2_i1.p1 TRINITY_DN3288_c0_g2~~TRINITY_DN3288_c0_g2_i1.p1  ORF type:complete len:126 (-),score=30.50 TRINITY_DN3288_c0_g2_i1:174-551(-)
MKRFFQGSSLESKLESFFISSDLSKLVETFGNAHCSKFANPTGEYTHEQYDLYQKYVAMIEEALEGFIKKEKIDKKQIYDLCSKGTSEAQERSSCMDVINACTDYLQFAQLMSDFLTMKDFDFDF